MTGKLLSGCAAMLGEKVSVLLLLIDIIGIEGQGH